MSKDDVRSSLNRYTLIKNELKKRILSELYVCKILFINRIKALLYGN